MTWDNPYIEKLQQENSVQFRPRGNSMAPKIKSGQLVTVAPITQSNSVIQGDIVLCQVKGRQFLHRVKSVDSQKSKYLISNNRGVENGWTTLVYGTFVSITN